MTSSAFMFVPYTYGLEFFVLPLIGLPYFYYISEFTLCAALFNNCLLTLVFAGFALWRSHTIAEAIPRNSRRRRLDPVWPALSGVVLVFLGALQLILSVAHLSYYRTAGLIPDLFER